MIANHILIFRFNVSELQDIFQRRMCCIVSFRDEEFYVLLIEWWRASVSTNLFWKKKKILLKEINQRKMYTIIYVYLYKLKGK